MPPKTGKKHTTTAEHRAVLDELKARKEEAKRLLVDLRAKRKQEDRRHSRLIKQAKKLNPKDLLEIAAVSGITAQQMQEMASRMSSSSAAPPPNQAPAENHPEQQHAHAEPEGHHIAVIDPAEYPLVVAELPDA